MGFADSFGEFHGLRRFWKRDNDDGAADGVHTSPGGVGTHERGIRGGPQQGRSKRRAWAMLDGNGTNDDGVGWTLYALRGSQVSAVPYNVTTSLNYHPPLPDILLLCRYLHQRRTSINTEEMGCRPIRPGDIQLCVDWCTG